MGGFFGYINMIFNRKNIKQVRLKLQSLNTYLTYSIDNLEVNKRSMFTKSLKVLDDDIFELENSKDKDKKSIVKYSNLIFHSIKTINFLFNKIVYDTNISNILKNEVVYLDNLSKLESGPGYSYVLHPEIKNKSEGMTSYDVIYDLLCDIKEIYIDIYIELNNYAISLSDSSMAGQIKLTKEIIYDLFSQQFDDISESIQSELDERTSDLNEKISQMGRFLDDVRGGLDSESSRLSDQSKNAIETIKASGNHQVNDIRKKLSEFQISLEKQLEAKEANLSTALESKVDNAIDSHMENLQELNTLIEESYKKADAEYMAFRTLYEEMKEMYQIAGKGELQKYNLDQAEVERKEADNLRKYGGWTMLLPLFVAGFIFYDLVVAKPDFTIGWVLTRFLTLTIFSMPMLYSLKESANHRFRENLYRQRGTQLATLGSYLDDFDLERKIALKTELAKNFYSVNTGKADTSHIPDPTAQIKEVAALSKSLSKIIPTQPIMYPKHNHQEVPSSVHLQPDNPTPEKGEDGKPKAINGHG